MFPRRLFRLAVLFVVGFLALALRLAYVQVHIGPTLRQEASANAARTQALPAPRGTLFDRLGNVLVRNRPRFTLTFVPATTRQPEKLVEELCGVLQLPRESRRRLLERVKSQPLEPINLKDRLDEGGLARMAELQGAFPGLTLEAQPVREYPNRKVASHLLGHIGEVDPATLEEGQHHSGEWVGKDGLELAWQKELRGEPGTRIRQVDAAGRSVRLLRELPGEPGHDLYLTLDLELQKVAEKALETTLKQLATRNGEPGAGAVVAMEADTGRIRALVSLPSFDPSWFSQGASSGQFQALLSDARAPLLNRAVHSAFPPGSTFKLVTSAAAFSENLIAPGATWWCAGSYLVGNLPFNCFVRSGHGGVTFETALAHSCDVVYYMLGVQLGHERLARYASAFGIGRPTGIDLPGEVGGILPDAAYKKKATGEGWFAGDDANMAIGQGFLAVTPLQMAVVTAAVANGGDVLRPYLVERVRTPAGGVVREVKPEVRGHIELKPEHLKRIREGMRGAVAYGTATRAFDPHLLLAGKTGTVENIATSDNPQGRNHTWFVCYGPLRPARPGKKNEKNSLVVVVFLEKSGGYGGALAAPIAHDVVASWEARRRMKAP